MASGDAELMTLQGVALRGNSSYRRVSFLIPVITFDASNAVPRGSGKFVVRTSAPAQQVDNEIRVASVPDAMPTDLDLPLERFIQGISVTVCTHGWCQGSCRVSQPIAWHMVALNALRRTRIRCRASAAVGLWERRPAVGCRLTYPPAQRAVYLSGRLAAFRRALTAAEKRAAGFARQ